MKGKVLLVDDEEYLLESLGEMLSKQGLNVILAQSGALGLEIAMTETLDAVISDIQMPAMSGLEFLRRAKQAGCNVPFVLITGFATQEKLLEALRLGAVDFIEKPFNYDQLFEAVGRAVELGSKLRETGNGPNCLSCQASQPSKEPERFERMRLASMQLKVESEIYLQKKEGGKK